MNTEFKKVMIPALLMGVITNIGIVCLFIFLKTYSIIYSPGLGAILFLAYFFLLKKDKISHKQSYLLVAITVIIEVCSHSYFLGWETGFYYYIFLLPILFLTGSSWSKKATIYINISVLLVTGLIWYFMHNVSAFFSIPLDVKSNIHSLNLAGTALINLVIMIYFSWTINKKDLKITKANIDLELQNKEIVGQHRNLEILLKEIHHRVKNNLQIISSLMSLERNKVENQEVITILNESKRRVEAIALIHKKLYQNKVFNQVDFKSYLEELMNSQQAITSNVNCTVVAVTTTINLDTAVPLGLIISEMITNSIKHAFTDVKNPELKIELSCVEDGFELIVKDNGIGLPKGFDLEKPSSLGTEIINALRDQINARIEYANDGGALFKIYFKNI